MKRAARSLCAPGWQVCSPRHSSSLTLLTWTDVTRLPGCYAYNAANTLNLCSVYNNHPLTCLLYYSPPVRQRGIVMRVSVGVSVCLSVCLSASMSQGLHVISLLIFACYQWLAPSPVALRYVMYYTSGVLNDVIFAHYRQNMQRENGRSSGSSMRSRAQTDIHER